LPINGMNVGVDYNISYYESTSGTLISLGDVQSVKIIANKHDIKSAPYNQVPRFGYVPDGYKVDFTITRTGSILELLMTTFSVNFNAGNIITPGFLNQSVNNPDGTVSRFQYTNFVVFLTDHGDISREKVVSLRLEGMASDKIVIA
jgi:hypothetical protein